MKMKVMDAILSHGALQTFGRMDIPFEPSMTIAANIRELQAAVDVYNDKRQTLLKKFGKPDEKNPNQYTFEGDNAQKFNDEEKKLSQQEVDIKLRTIKKADLKQDGKLPDVAPNVLVALGWLIKG